MLQIGLQVCSSLSVAEIEALFVFEPGMKRMKRLFSGHLGNPVALSPLVHRVVSLLFVTDRKRPQRAWSRFSSDMTDMNE